MSNFQFSRSSNFPPVVKNLIIINVLVWIAQLSLDSQYQITIRGGLWPVDTPLFEPYQIFTHLFLHAPSLNQFYHILFNMFALFMFGRVLENLWGPKKFLFYYFACGVGAAGLHLLVQHLQGGVAPAIGASGAVMGILVGFGYTYPNTELIILPIPIPVKAKWVVIGYALIDLFGGIGAFGGDNIAHFAHLGGALTGFIILLIWNKTKRKTLY